MSGRHARMLHGAAASLLIVGVGAIAAPAGAATSSALPANCTGTATVTCTFGWTGVAQTWRVPAGVSSARFVLMGAQGSDYAYARGGLGGQTAATVALTPGMTLNVTVGGAGSFIGGFNGGGTSVVQNYIYQGGGGGGASDIRIAGNALSNRVLVAGGGGGSSGLCSTQACTRGGNGGGLVGGDGSTTSLGGTTEGKGGSQSAGGAGTDGSSSGAAGTGGNAVNLGGAGGGGYFGGGGGSFDFMTAGAGGGGSSFIRHDTAHIKNTSMLAGVRSGNGLVTITYSRP